MSRSMFSKGAPEFTIGKYVESQVCAILGIPTYFSIVNYAPLLNMERDIGSCLIELARIIPLSLPSRVLDSPPYKNSI